MVWPIAKKANGKQKQSISSETKKLSVSPEDLAMHRQKFTPLSAALGNLVLFLLLILAISCSTSPQPAGEKAVPASLPSYELGTTYVYSNGSWETVAGISPQLVTWRNHHGSVYERYPDFTHRSVRWKTSTREGSRRFGAFSYYYIKGNNSVWPLQKGNLSSFQEMVTSRKIGEPEKSYQVNWTCEVIGTERVAVLAGEFDTWKIACSRYNNFSEPSKARVREIRTWNYAPEIKHFVLTERKYSSRKAARRVELLAVLPSQNGLSDVTRHQMNQAFQIALENKKSGESAAWSIPNTSWSGQVTPTKTFKLADGRYSRRYIQKVNHPDGQRIYHGLALRDVSGKWVVPRR
jgi:surface antigen